MPAHLLTPLEKHWECPSCGLQHVTNEPKPHTPMHNCVKLNGLVAPFVEVFGDQLEKHSVQHKVVVRGDYLGDELARFDGAGKPITAVLTERADGSNDCYAFAATANGIGN